MSVAARFSAAVVSYDTREHLPACLAALEHEGASETLVVDNASPDGSAALVRERFPSVTLIANDTNVGYGAAANQALAACSAEYVLLLNGDAVPEPGTLAALARYLDEHPEAGVVGPLLRYPDGRLQPSCYPFLTPVNVLLVMSGVNGVIGRIPLLRARHLPTSPHRRAGPVPWVKGAALAVRKVAFESVGGFDESFFLYSEEQDLCYRLGRRLGDAFCAGRDRRPRRGSELAGGADGRVRARLSQPGPLLPASLLAGTPGGAAFRPGVPDDRTYRS